MLQIVSTAPPPPALVDMHLTDALVTFTSGVFLQKNVKIGLENKKALWLAALFYSPADFTDASDMHHSNARLMHR